MVRIAIYLLETLLLLTNSAYINRIDRYDFLQPASSVSSLGGELSKADALAVMRDYIKVNHMERDGYELRIVARVQMAQGDAYLLVYFDPALETECGNEPQGNTFSTMPVFDDGCFFKVEAKTGNVELYKTKEKFIGGQ